MTKAPFPVYSTEHGRMCPDCGSPHARCTCKSNASQAPLGDGKVRISCETKGRKGKGVTLISGLSLTQYELERLTQELKRKCGSGGTLKNGIIEIQGDHRDTLLAEIVQKGYQAKIAGG